MRLAHVIEKNKYLVKVPSSIIGNRVVLTFIFHFVKRSAVNVNTVLSTSSLNVNWRFPRFIDIDLSQHEIACKRFMSTGTVTGYGSQIYEFDLNRRT